MRIRVGAALCVIIVVCGVAAGSSQLFPERHRHGKVYRQVLQAEDAHHARLGYTPNKTASYFPQLIDHSDSRLGTFLNKFYYDTSMWKNGGPCMMYLNGEGPLGSSVTGYMAELASDLGACTVSIEHRWYGESLPGNLTDKALMERTLTIEQAMADIIALQEHFKKLVGRSDFDWFLVGGSYSGAVTIWMNVVYPFAFKASWAASGVVQPIFDYYQYDDHIADVVSEDCKRAIQNVMAIASEWWDDPSQQKILAQMLALKPELKQTKTDVMWGLADVSAANVQYSNKLDMCNSILPVSKNPTENIQKYIAMINKTFGLDFISSCYYSTACLANASMNDLWGGAGYSWIFQCCSEVAWWQIGYPDSIRSEDVNSAYFMEQCQAAFYPDTTPNPWALVKKFGGLQPRTKGKIVATQGSDDPWMTAGLQTSLGPTFPVLVAQCDDCGHCSSMSSPRPSDPPALVVQREAVKQYLTEWLQ